MLDEHIKVVPEQKCCVKQNQISHSIFSE